MKIAICQPTYLPWIGYFALLDQVDTFVFLDDVQFEKRSWQQRNRIKGPSGLQFLTIPVMSRGRYDQLLKDVEIAHPTFWRDHCRTIALHYQRSPFFESFSKALESNLNCHEMRLADFTIRVIEWMARQLGIHTPAIRASELKQSGKRSERLANICKCLGATQYYSPAGSTDYLREEQEVFAESGIEVFLQAYEHPEYSQLFPPFVPYASALDLVLNEGDRSLQILRSGRRPFHSLHETEFVVSGEAQ